MPTTRTLKAYDYKYEARVWRKDVAESFQKTKTVKTDYVVNDGQIAETIETTWEFASAKAARTNQLPDPPGGTTFLYIDGSYRKEAAYIFQITHIKTTTYQAYGTDAYLLTIEDRDVLNNTVTTTTSIIDGKAPLAPTVNSALSNLIQQPILNVLDDNCDFIPGTDTIDGTYLDDGSDAAKAAKRAMQRNTAIVRRVKHAANPLMKIGHTIRLVDPARGLDARHILTRRTIEMTDAGAADEVLEMEFWTR